tara:strand:+ start:1495 stop:2250 length:756 start_codon:yes stop_codon:yes gene_type:complete
MFEFLFNVDYMISSVDTAKHKARFGNKFFRNMCGYYIAKSQNVKCLFDKPELFKRLGINFEEVQTDDKIDLPKITLQDEDIMKYINKEKMINNEILHVAKGYCQTKEFAKYIIDNFGMFKSSVIEDNNDVFVHVRCGDINNSMMPPLEYYTKTLREISYSKGFIASDNFDHEYCKKLIKKFNLEKVDLDYIDTIKFGASKKHIILSPGTFSWMIGLLSFGSNIYYYPPKLLKLVWHGDIFEATDWNRYTLL